MPYKYETSGPAIYRESFAIIRSEAELGRFSVEEETVAVRMIHAAGLVELAAYIHFQNDVVNKARAALEQGAPILCDARMVSEGITRKRLPWKAPWSPLATHPPRCFICSICSKTRHARARRRSSAAR